MAHAPSVDPTRSSWLPLHSLVLGALMALAGDPRVAPYLLSLSSGIVALAALSRALRRESLAAPGAVIALIVLATWRWSLFSAASGALPEMPAVALLCVALERWRAGTTGAAWQAGIALALACGCRYEAWFAVVGFALAAPERSRPRAHAVVALTLAAIVPLSWLWINHAHRGDALDFVHRVAAHRRAVTDALVPGWRRMLAVGVGLGGELPWAVVTLACLSRAMRRSPVARVGAAMALAVAGGLLFEAWRGGGATHHEARTLLPVAWLLAPALAVTLDELLADRRRAWVLACALACVAWGAPRWAEVAAMGAPDAAAMGAEVARRWPTGPWCLELQRQDALWIEWRSAAVERMVADRAYGGRADDPATRAGRCASARGAVSSSWEWTEALRAQGFRVVARRGPWAMLERPE